MAEADRGALASTQATVGELLERWFEQAKEDFSPKTVKETRGLLDPYGCWTDHLEERERDGSRTR